MQEFIVEVIRHPEKDDWERCKSFALSTEGKEYKGKPVTDDWKVKILKAGHSPIRTLMFTIKMEIPYYISVHFVRHKFGVEHYAQYQRNDRQNKYDRAIAPQNEIVMYTMDINAQELIFMANRMLCGKAYVDTRYVMQAICREVLKTNPEFAELLVPMCEAKRGCDEMLYCGYYEKIKLVDAVDNFMDNLPVE